MRGDGTRSNWNLYILEFITDSEGCLDSLGDFKNTENENTTIIFPGNKGRTILSK